MAALGWLLCQPGITAQTINKCRQQLLAIPCVPLAAAKALIAAGLRMQITGQQLVEAAYSCMEGLEVWVAAFASAGVPRQEWAADLAPGMRHVCCYRYLPKQVCLQLYKYSLKTLGPFLDPFLFLPYLHMEGRRLKQVMALLLMSRTCNCDLCNLCSQAVQVLCSPANFRLASVMLV
jgi:hypothetical protein